MFLLLVRAERREEGELSTDIPPAPPLESDGTVQYISNNKRIALLFQSFVKSDMNELLTVAL